MWLEKTDGTLVSAPPVADSEDELREFLADLGARQNRPFTEARPHLDLRLPGGARLAAASWVTANTSVVIRRHGLREVSLDEMVYDRKACGPVLADFLAACVRAGKSIVVSGVQGSGKTTWVRALCSCIPPWEMIGTFETEFELHLHELVDRHQIVHAWEHRPGSGEVGIDGRQAGEFTLEEAIHHSFRFNLARQIVGEVRGPEVWNMLKAMESGPGSICTTHARSAEHTIEKLVSCAMEKGPQVTRELAISKLAAAVDVVVYLRADVADNRRRHLPQAALGRGGPGRRTERRRGQGLRDPPVFTPNAAGTGRRHRQAGPPSGSRAGPPRLRPRGLHDRGQGLRRGGDRHDPARARRLRRSGRRRPDRHGLSPCGRHRPSRPGRRAPSPRSGGSASASPRSARAPARSSSPALLPACWSRWSPAG